MERFILQSGFKAMRTTNDKSKQQQVRRMVELGRIARERHLDTVGNPHLSVGSFNNNDTLTQQERQEFLVTSTTGSGATSNRVCKI